MQRLKPRKAGRLLIATLASSLLLTNLTGCGDKTPPIVSGDTYCEKARHISATEAQIEVFRANWDVMESYADQVVAHNLTYDGDCLKADPRGKGK